MWITSQFLKIYKDQFGEIIVEIAAPGSYTSKDTTENWGSSALLSIWRAWNPVSNQKSEMQNRDKSSENGWCNDVLVRLNQEPAISPYILLKCRQSLRGFPPASDKWQVVF